MSTNQGPEYFAAEKNYLVAQTADERIYWLQEMIRNFRKHKGSENMLAELKRRLRKLEEKKERGKKAGKGKKGIRKEGYQVVLVGLTNSGKSSLLARLTNARPVISEFPFTTRKPEIGMMEYTGVKAQIVDMASIGSDEFDFGIANTSDCVLEVVDKLEDLDKVGEVLGKISGKRIAVISKADKIGESELRRLEEKVKSKRLNAVIVSCESGYGIEELKEKIFREMEVIRVYTKEPGKEKTEIPIVLHYGATVRDVAEKILKGFSNKVKETRVTGPSSKFPNQRVGLNHELKDRDVVEFKTK